MGACKMDDKKNVFQNLKELLETVEYDDFESIERIVEKAKQNAIIKEIDFQPLCFFYPYKLMQVELNYEVGYSKIDEKYVIRHSKSKEIKKPSKGSYGEYYSFTYKGERINLSDWILKEDLKYTNEQEFRRLTINWLLASVDYRIKSFTDGDLARLEKKAKEKGKTIPCDDFDIEFLIDKLYELDTSFITNEELKEVTTGKEKQETKKRLTWIILKKLYESINIFL